MICSMIYLSCSSSTDQNCNEGYPKVFSNQIDYKNQIDVYHFENGQLTLVRSIFPPSTDEVRTITLLSTNELNDTWVSPGNLNYTNENGCIVDDREWQKIRINDDCTQITIDIMSVGVNGGWIVANYDCSDQEEDAIQDGIDFFRDIEVFDSVYVDKLNIELHLEM